MPDEDDEYVPDYIDVEIEENDGASTIRLIGEVDALVAPELRKLLISCLESGRVVIDMSRVTFIDSSGLGALIGARLTIPPEADDRMVLRNVPTAIRTTFEVAGVAHLLRDG